MEKEGGQELFGYIKPYKPEMKMKEFDTYKAVYCGLCKQLGKVYGPFARLTLSYDFTFLSMVSLSLSDKCGGFRMEKCVANPLKKKPCMVPCGDLTLSASAAMIMFYYKLKDNIQDSGIGGRIKAYLLLPFAAAARKRAKKLHPELEEIVGTCMQEQYEVEHSDSDSIDRAAEPTAKALSQIFERLSEHHAQRRVLSRLGYLVGRYVYLIDALDDLEDDIKTGSYNILYRKAQKDGTEQLSEIRTYAQGVLNLTVGQIAAAYELLDLKRYKTILDNLIYLGLHQSLKAVLEKGTSKPNAADQTEIETNGKEITV